MSDKIRVFMVDDHDFILSVTKPFLEKSGLKVVGTETTFSGTIEHAFDHQPDVIIIDLNIAGQSGIDLIKELKAIKKDCKTIIFSARTAIPVMAAAYRAGAKGYLTKKNEPGELVNAIKKVYEGKTYYMPGYAELILSYQSDQTNIDPRDVLNEREYKLFLLLAQGKSHEAIAGILDIGPKSVSNTASKIRKKLGNTTDDFANIANLHGIAFFREN